MLTTAQLKFIHDSLTAQNAAVPAGDGGKIVRMFVSVLDELDAQEKALKVESNAAMKAPGDAEA